MLIDDLTLSMEVARRAGLLDGMSEEEIQDRANRRAEFKSKERNQYSMSDEERQAVCEACDELVSGTICKPLKDKFGCGSNRPWMSQTLRCPSDAWT